MKWYAWLVVAFVVVIIIFLGQVIIRPEPLPETSLTIPIRFMNHLEAKLPEQDVFIRGRGEVANQVFRLEVINPQDQSVLDEMVFASAQPVAHDPFKSGSQPLGPFPQGAALGFSLRRWLAATGSGTYLVKNSGAEINISFQNLVPNGLYTVWCSRFKSPPNFAAVDEPCGAKDGSQNTFRADAIGNGVYKVSLNQPVENRTETPPVIVISYHSDNRTHGSKPGNFGKNTHVQLFLLVM